MEIYREIHFEAAHFLPHVPDGHKCRRLHGHSYRIDLHLAGPVDPVFGWVVDYGDVKDAFTPIYLQLDHHVLNEVPGLENPTSEHLARWIWYHLKPVLPKLVKIVVHETSTSGCIYTGDE